MCLQTRFGLRRLSKQLQKLIHRPYALNPQNSMRRNIKYLDQPDRSEGDKKLYRSLKLENGLRAMLISDPNISNEDSKGSSRNNLRSSNSSMEQYHGKMAACAIVVEVGSFSEPQKYQGLAHFIEHMIFMGSEKYPGENEFDSFVTKSGGFSNASTENEETCFYFEVEETHLDKALDLFMNLMKEPIMNKDAMTRERSAVQSEFEQTYMSDEVRRDQVLASFAAKGYPHSTFSWGNLKSLQENVDDNDLHKAMHDFRKQHYMANRMIVCLQGEQSLDELEELVVRHCAQLPSNKDAGLDTKAFQYDKAFREQFYKDVILVQPVEDICKVELTWVLPSVRPYYRSKPDAFLAQLLGYEGVGSLCSYLRKHLWCMSVNAGIDNSSFESNSIYSLFVICIYLTDEGFEHLDEVLGLTFAWIKLFNDCNTLHNPYKEVQQIAANNFRFQIELSPLENVQIVAQSLRDYPPKDVLTGSEIFFEYDEPLLKKLKNHLCSFNFNVMISSHIPFENNEYDTKEPWFGTAYKTIPMPERWKRLWDNPPKLSELQLPQPNHFIPTDFRLHWKEAGSPPLSRRPKLLSKSDLHELWFRQDDTFLLPDGYINLYFITPYLQHSPKNCMIASIYTYLVEFTIAEQLYPAIEAGLAYSIHTSDKGLTVRVNGYNEKLGYLLEVILKIMSTLQVDPPQVMSLKELKKRQLFNSLISAASLNLDLRLNVLEEHRFNMIEKYEAINTVTVDDIQQFKDNFHKQMYIQGHIQGNFAEEEARSIMDKVLSTFNSAKIEDLGALSNKLVQLPLGSHYLRVKTLNGEDTNSIITNYYQIGATSLREECLLDLVEIIVEEPFFNQLRTQEQLGYSLGIYQRIGYGVLAYVITVNSQETKFKSNFIEERIENFRSQMPSLVNRLSDEEFNDVRESLINGKKLGDTSLYDEVMRNWSEIATMQYFFNRRSKEIKEVATLTKQDVLDFLSNYENNNFRKLSVQVVGKSTPPIRTPTESISSAVMVRHLPIMGPGVRRGALRELVEEVQKTISEEQLLFETIGDKIKLEFLGNPADPSHITNISEFKKNLYIFPLINTIQKIAKN